MGSCMGLGHVAWSAGPSVSKVRARLGVHFTGGAEEGGQWGRPAPGGLPTAVARAGVLLLRALGVRRPASAGEGQYQCRGGGGGGGSARGQVRCGERRRP